MTPFCDGKLIPIDTERQSQLSNNNMLFHLPPTSIQVQSNNDEKQKSNSNTIDQVQQQQPVLSLMDIVEQKPCNNKVYNDVQNRHNDNKLVMNCTKITLQYGTSQHKVIETYINQSWINLAPQLRCEGK